MRRHPAGKHMSNIGATILPFRRVRSQATTTTEKGNIMASKTATAPAAEKAAEDTTTDAPAAEATTEAPATAKAGRKSAEEKAALPALDFDALTVEDAEVPAITRQRDEKPNPFAASLLATFDARQAGNEKAGKAVTVPTARAGEVKYLIRQGAKKHGIGARIVETDNGDGTTRIVFAGTKKKERAPKDAAPAAEGAAPEAPAVSENAPAEVVAPTS